MKAALTVADTAAQEAVLVPLYEHFPGVRLEAEEDTPTVARFDGDSDACVVLDPIDGTLRFYLEQLGPYGVMVGLAIEGVYQAGLVALPREDLFFDAVRGQGARIARGSGPPQTAASAARVRRVFISHDLPGPSVEVLLAHGFEVAPASGGAISVAPLVPGVRAGLRWMPRGSVSSRGRVGALIAAEAGALVRNERGEAFPARLDVPARGLLVASDGDDLEALVQAAAAAGAAA